MSELSPAVRPAPGALQKSQQDKHDMVRGLLAANARTITASLPKGMDYARLCRLALNCAVRNPYLLECQPQSFMLAVVNCAEMGLEPGPQNHVALVPYKGVVQAQPQYQGLMELARRSGAISYFDAEVVREGDEFLYERGLEPRLVHRPKVGYGNPWSHVYAVAHFRDGGKVFRVMDRDEVLATGRARSASVKGGRSSPWDTDEEAMARKTVIKRLLKMCPTTPEIAAAMDADDAAETGLPVAPGFIEVPCEVVPDPPAPAENTAAKIAARRGRPPKAVSAPVETVSEPTPSHSGISFEEPPEATEPAPVEAVEKPADKTDAIKAEVAKWPEKARAVFAAKYGELMGEGFESSHAIEQAYDATKKALGA